MRHARCARCSSLNARGRWLCASSPGGPRDPGRPDRRPDADQITDPLTAECAWDVPGDHQVENPDGEVVVLAEGDGGEIHDPEVTIDHLHEGDLVVASGLRIELGVGRVDPVDAGVGPLAEE